METVMTKSYWEENYRREYRRRLHKKQEKICKRIVGLIISTGVFYGIMCLIAIIADALCNISFGFI